MGRIWRVEHLVPVTGLVIFALVSFGVPDRPCTPATPCTPDVPWWVAQGLLLAPMTMVYVHRWAAAWATVGCAASWLLLDRYLDDHLGPAVLLPWAYVVVAVVVARRGADRMEQIAPRAAVPAPATLPRVNRRYLALAAAVLVAAAALGGWVLWRQDSAARARAGGTLLSGVVLRQVDGDGGPAIDVDLAGAAVQRAEVRNLADYPAGAPVQMYVGGHGLRELRSEPYDSTPLLAFVVAAAGFAVALLTRAGRRRRDLRTLFASPQPVRTVRVADDFGYVHVLVPAADGRTAVEFGIYVDEPEPPTARDDDRDPKTVPALLYGEPRPGHWCAVQVDGRVRVPLAPVDATVQVPYDAEHHLPREVADDDRQLVEEGQLTEDDRNAAPGDVREHRVTPLRRWFEAIAIGVGVTVTAAQIIHLAGGWGGRPAVVTIAVVAALAYEFGWRTQLRPRLRWDVGGVVAVTFRRRERAMWTPDSGVVHDDDGTVIVTTGDVVLVVDAPRPWPSWAAQRTAGQLVAALRDARRQALDTAGAPAPPDLAEPARPLALYLVWAVTVAGAVALFGW
jgi:hypothetical protein